jgi:predicted ATPase
LHVVNFGPIDKANVQLTNCSFFAGKNNVGKSVMAQLLYSILKVFNPTMEDASLYLPELVENEFSKLIEEVVKKSSKTKTSSKKSSRKKSSKNGGSWKISQKDLKTIKDLSQKRKEKIKKRINTELSSYCQKELKKKIKQEITRVFSAPIHDYVRLGEDNSKVLFEYNDVIYKCIFSMGIYRKSKSFRTETVLTVDDDFLNKYIDEMFKIPLKHLKAKSVKFQWNEKGKLEVKFPFRSVDDKIRDLPIQLYKPSRTYFIPAGRAGLLEGYKVVSNAFYQSAPTASLVDTKSPSISGVVADYYSLLMSFEGKKGHYNKIAKDLLSKTMEGLVEMDEDEYPFSVMKYRLKTPNNDETIIDITKASSMVKELAPVFMVVAEKLRPNDVLIIEEPESHLQSKTQLELAEFFFNLSRGGARILVTTHSELMLRQSFQLFNEKDLPITGNLFIFKETV